MKSTIKLANTLQKLLQFYSHEKDIQLKTKVILIYIIQKPKVICSIIFLIE
ncbi:unknown; predicted coding region [Mycoplasmopsis pulmonis]|uniref:Uncharacterized protein n=1 Tax=Mycoplasmopsis pulmonis (strain UAB CTIP) TaxID=272635 RepID=Q98PP0_MYCPU|nr:hypothetical protein [Mycoplasmopsis pulmonis]MDZ7293468.1 hypothetical protein [Mycoplasmopsis pulmonis]CAC13853.1 unknown; predicted coding region [Mycoplasmopsis pulmonis]